MDEPGGMMAAGPGFEQDVAVETIWKLAVGVCIGENCYRAFISRERFDEHIAPLLKLAAPPAVWSRERPTKEGWYWWKVSHGAGAGIPVVVQLVPTGIGDNLIARGSIEVPSNALVLKGEWAGPLRPPVEGKG